MQFIANYEDVKLEAPVEIISVLGTPRMEYNILSNFPMNSYKQEEFDLLKNKLSYLIIYRYNKVFGFLRDVLQNC